MSAKKCTKIVSTSPNQGNRPAQVYIKLKVYRKSHIDYFKKQITTLQKF